MRVVRMILMLAVLAPMLDLMTGGALLRAVAIAQVPAPAAVAPPAPLQNLAPPVVLPVPAAPGAPAALATTAAVPVLAPAPTVVSAVSAQAATMTLRCSCFGTGLGIQWAGVIEASSFTSAAQAAQGQCATYQIETNVNSPYISAPSNITLPKTAGGYPAVRAFVAPGDVVASNSAKIPAGGNISAATLQSLAASGLCARCVCN